LALVNAEWGSALDPVVCMEQFGGLAEAATRVADLLT
jgi:hypothetical protein